MAALLLVSCSKEEASEGFVIKRGTNLSHWLSQSFERGEARRLHIQEADFARLEELGFDHVRIPIDEEQFWDEEGNMTMKQSVDISLTIDERIVDGFYYAKSIRLFKKLAAGY